VPDQPDPVTAPLPPVQPSSPHWVLGGRYRVIDRLGRGGMAEVFRAHDELLDRDVAVKVFKTGMDGDDDTHGEVRRELELQSLARLSHPHLITLFDGSVVGEGPAYLVLELVHGPDLASRLREGPLPEPEAREIGAQIADALAYVHARGMVHRDVKPANILLGMDDAMPGAVRARLSDFGIVRMVGNSRMTAADMTLGTASYVAPEQARGANVGPPADVYSLALVLIESLTGVRCFDGPIHEALAARLAVAPEIPTGLPTPWPDLLAAMTRLDPDDRPDAGEVARSLRDGVTPALAGSAAGDDSPTAAIPVTAAGAAAVVGVAGVAGAAAAVDDALPAADSETAALAATGAVPAAASAPMAAAPAGPPPPVSYPDEPPEYDDGDPRRGRRTAALVLAALAFVAVLAGAGFLLLGGSSDSPADSPPTTVRTGDASTTTPSRSHRSVSQAAQVETTRARDTSSDRASKSSSKPARSSTAAPSASVVPRTSAPVTRPTSSTAPTSSSASTNSSTSPASPPSSSASGAAGAAGPPSPTSPSP
jgi:hypothetical protein